VLAVEYGVGREMQYLAKLGAHRSGEIRIEIERFEHIFSADQDGDRIGFAPAKWKPWDPTSFIFCRYLCQ
jgi:hypothetical protein